MNKDLITIPPVEEISSLPGQIESIQQELYCLISTYQRVVEDIEAACIRKDLDKTGELCEKADQIDQEINALTGKLQKTKSALDALVTIKLTKAQAVFNKIMGYSIPQLAKNSPLFEVAEAIADARRAHETDDLPEALLKVHQAMCLLDSVLRNQLQARVAHHAARLEILLRMRDHLTVKRP